MCIVKAEMIEAKQQGWSEPICYVCPDKVNKKTTKEAEAGYAGFIELRPLHVELDSAIRDAYGWHDLNLGHDFIEVETLPENDRVRYTLSPEARKEILKRLLAEIHRYATEQVAAMPVKAVKMQRKAKGDNRTNDIFD